MAAWPLCCQVSVRLPQAHTENFVSVYVTKFRSHHVTYPRRSHFKAKSLKPRNQASQFVDLLFGVFFSFGTIKCWPFLL